MLATVLIETRPTKRLVQCRGRRSSAKATSDQVFVEVAPGEVPHDAGQAGAFHLNNERKRKETD
jgi:hypothetical protein